MRGVNSTPLARHLLRARDVVDSRYAQPLDLGALGRAAHVSPRHFSRRFRRVAHLEKKSCGRTIKVAGRPIQHTDRRHQKMLDAISHVAVWVHDQDVAKEFYTEKLGFEVREDNTLIVQPLEYDIETVKLQQAERA